MSTLPPKPAVENSHLEEERQCSEVSSHRPFWQRLLQETRTRILLLYALLLLILSGIAVPIFRHLLFASVNNRVQQSLDEEQEAFEFAYAAWEGAPNQSIAALETFADDFLKSTRPEDDNFQLILIDGELYRSNPYYLLAPLQPGSELFKHWQTVTQPVFGEKSTPDSDVGSVFFSAKPIELDGQQRGVFVVAHSAAGEEQEALVGVYLFAKFMVVAVLVSLFIAWLLAGKLMAPIMALSRTALSISESDLNQRISVPRGQNELSELTHTFNAMMNRIQSAFDSQRAFINDAGHELRTPITIIQGHLELMNGEPQERQETMELVMDELDRMGRLVSDMILLAKSERPNFLQLETIPVQAFAEELFAKATALADRQWQLTEDDTQSPTETVLGDRQKLTGAILNLLRNAAQHTQPANSIELGYRFTHFGTNQNCRCVQFWVRDTGKGICVDDQQRIFARFTRGQQRRSDGSGLGLAIAKTVAEAHGGQITLTSPQGQGATFYLTLPKNPQPPGSVVVPPIKVL
ncbi:MAG: HAMP domain-containing sensor histidine kinase [Cyanobacteria bacterium J06634_5]